MKFIHCLAGGANLRASQANQAYAKASHDELLSAVSADLPDDTLNHPPSHAGVPDMPSKTSIHTATSHQLLLSGMPGLNQNAVLVCAGSRL